MNTMTNKMTKTFKFEINERVFIKGDWENVYKVYKINGRNYQLKTQDDFISNTWRNDNELTNSRKSDFLKSLRENKMEQNKLNNAVINDIYKYINWNVKNRPCKFLFTNEKNAPKQVFYWQEEDYDGSIFVVYEYLFENKVFYLCLNSRFGSCSGCDDWENMGYDKEALAVKRDYIEREYKNIYIKLSKHDIKHKHPECNEKLTNWKKTTPN